VGHTGGSGDRGKDLALSKRRAEAVKKALVQREVRGSRLTATGKGSEEPLAPNITNSGRRLNERVEIRLRGSEAKPSTEAKQSI
jgi:outer membrane protein OmpA-like peptidoglycan-associated protein